MLHLGGRTVKNLTPRDGGTSAVMVVRILLVFNLFAILVNMDLHLHSLRISYCEKEAKFGLWETLNIAENSSLPKRK